MKRWHRNLLLFAASLLFGGLLAWYLWHQKVEERRRLREKDEQREREKQEQNVSQLPKTPVEAAKPSTEPPNEIQTPNEILAPREIQIALVAEISDPERRPLTVTWTQLSGPPAVIHDPLATETYFTATEQGIYVFEIAAFNDLNVFRKKIQKVITFTDDIALPIAIVGDDQNFSVGEWVKIIGVKNKTSDGWIVAWSWKQIDGPPLPLPRYLASKEFYFDPQKQGLYVFELTVSDGKKWSAPSRVMIRVAQGNQLSAVVKPGKTIKLGEEIVCDGSASFDPQGEKLTYFWEQIRDDAPLLQPSVDPKDTKSLFEKPIWRFKPNQPGTYKFRLIVSANGGKREATSEVVKFVVLAE